MARTPRVEDRREQIMEAAMRVFAQKGFMRATNKDIAREAGITTGLIYHYFESKEALLKAIVESTSPVYLTRSIAPEMLTLPPKTLIRSLLLRMLNVVEGEEFVQLLRVLLPEAVHNPALAAFGLPSYQEATKFLEDYLATKMESGQLRRADSAMTAQALMSAVMGFVLRRQILRDAVALRYTHEQIVDGLLESMVHGL